MGISEPGSARREAAGMFAVAEFHAVVGVPDGVGTKVLFVSRVPRVPCMLPSGVLLDAHMLPQIPYTLFCCFNVDIKTCNMCDSLVWRYRMWSAPWHPRPIFNSLQKVVGAGVPS